MKKRLLAAILFVFMVTSLLAGCAENTGASTVTENNNAGTTPEPTPSGENVSLTV